MFSDVTQKSAQNNKKTATEKLPSQTECENPEKLENLLGEA